MNQQPSRPGQSRNWPDPLAPTLNQFQQAWQTGTVPVIGQYLSADDEPGETWDESLRGQLLEELVKLDLQYRWCGFRQQDDTDVLMSRPDAVYRSGDTPDHWFLEDYLQQHPELGSPGSVSLDLVLEEYQVRQLWGDSPGHQQYLQRFPDHETVLRVLLPEIDCQLETVSPGEGAVATETLPHYGQAILAGATSTPKAPTLTGRFGDYELLEEIARGGMGVVYKAKQVSLDRTVAVKMIVSGQLANDREVRRFHTEAEAAARLQHPHIVAIHEVGELDGQHYFSMDYIEGQSLAQLVADGPLPMKQAVELVSKIATAVEYAHQAGILHRDLKPQNVLLDRSNQPLVTDFGLAKQIEGQSDLTGTGQVLGTPGYMPPEQAGLELAATSPASDVYSIGAILYELVTGRPPFRAQTAVDTVMQVRSQEPVAPRLLNASVPRDLETVILKCLEKQPSKRYTTAAEFLQELVRFQEGKPILARPVSVWERSWRWCKRKPALAGMWALAAVLLLTLSIAGPLVAVHQAKLRGQADHARRETTAGAAKTLEALQAAQQQVYLSDMRLAQRDWEDGNILHLRKLLDRHQGKETLKGFEWYYWNRLCHSERLSLAGHAGAVHAAAVSPDGKRIASASGDKTVKVWDSVSGEELLTLEGHHYPVNSVSFSPDGERIVSASMDTTVILWNSSTGKQLKTLLGHQGYVMSVAFNPDGTRIISGGDNSVKLWDVESGEELLAINAGAGQVHCVACSPDGKRIASGSSDHVVTLWDTETGKSLETFRGHDAMVHGVTFSLDGTHILSASADKTIKLWEIASGQLARTFRGHTDAVHSISGNADGSRLVSASADRTLKVWDAASGQEIFTLKGHSRLVRDASFSPDGKRIVSAGDGSNLQTGELKIWDAHTDPESLTWKGGDDLIWSVAFAPDGKQLVTGSAGKTAKVWDTRTAEAMRTLKEHNSVVTSVAFSAGGERIATCGDNRVKLWDAQTGELWRTLDAHKRRVTSVAFSPDGQRVASGSWDKTIKIWDAGTGEELLTLAGHENYVRSVVFSPDGESIASASNDKTVRLWNLATGKLIWTVDGHAGPVSSVAISPDGKRIASGGADKVVKVWDAETGDPLFQLEGQYGAVYCVLFSPDGKRIAVGNYDSTIKLWDVHTGQETLTLKGHRSVVAGVSFSPDGQRLGSVSWDKTIKIWDSRPQRSK